jgi:hypothetical protein
MASMETTSGAVKTVPDAAFQASAKVIRSPVKPISKSKSEVNPRLQENMA